MAMTFAPEVSKLINNAGGLVQTLPDERVGGKTRNWVERIALAGQAIADQIMVARLPYGAVPLAFEISVSATLGASTVAIGNIDNHSKYSAGGTYTSANGTTNAINVATKGLPITSAWKYDDTVSTAFEDVLLTIGVSSLPSAGTLVVVTKYLDHSS